MASDFSDILGGRSLEKGNSEGASAFFKVTGIVALGLFAWMACSRGRVMFINWKETRYKKAMRRRHGIPDEDQRPFNVAYAAALRTREYGDSAPGGRRSRNALAEGQQSLRQRFNDVAPQIDTTLPWQMLNAPIIPQIAHAYAQIKQQQNNIQTDPLNFGARYNPDPPAVHATDSGLGDTSLKAPASSQQTSKQNGHGVTEHVRKRSIGDDEDDFEPVKKSRVEGKETADGDDEAAWAFKRGSKRGLALDEDDEGYESTRGDKRPRNTPKDAISEDQAAESNEMDMDEITDLRPIPRGKKRDRAEAGSTFGGDDDELDDPLVEKPSRRRKRKMLRKRQSDAQPQLRGKKRERDADSASEDEEDMKRSANSRRRKGVEAGDEGEEESEESLNESLASRSSYVKGRKIGEEWEVNGILYKVGPNRQRLRQALVKKARHRFPMPKDSQHPDREANLEVYVEKWLTEEEFKEAKERHELAWQDTPKPSAEQGEDGDAQDSSSIHGKNLLWASSPSATVNTPLGSPAHKRRVFRESIGADFGIRVNPLPDSQPTSRRRVVSAFGPLPPVAATDTPTRKGVRMFSKWEKQDLEAEAMAKLRAKQQQDQKKATPDARSFGLGAPPLAASASAPGPTNVGSANPFITASADKSGPTPITASVSFGAFPSSGESTKPADSGISSIFPLSTASNPLSKPSSGMSSSSTMTPSAFTSPFTSQPNNSKPDASADSSGSSNIPNFFSKKGSTTSPLSSTLEPSGTSTSQPTQPSAAPKVPVFGFSAPIGSHTSTPGGSNVFTSSSFSSFSNQAGKAPSSVFGDVRIDSKKAEPTKPAQASEGSGSTSLLDRLGGFAPPQSTSTSHSFAPVDSGPKFTFGKTDKSSAESTKPTSAFSLLPSTSETTKPTSVFGLSNTANEPAKTTNASAKSTSILGNTSTPQNTPPAVAPVSTTTAPAPKFNFGFSNKPASLASNSATGSTSTVNTESAKPTEAAFEFGTSKASVPLPAESSGANATAPKFKFGVTGGGSTFGSTSSLGSTSSTATPSATKSAFSGFTGGGNPFSTTPAASPNQAPNSTFSFGANGGNTSSSTFNKPAEPPKLSPFSGNPTSTTPSATRSASSAPANPPANSTASPFSFAFGSTTSKSTASSFGVQASTDAGSNTGAQSVFGKSSAPTPSAFGFGNNTSSSNSGAFGSFGQPEKNQQEKK